MALDEYRDSSSSNSLVEVVESNSEPPWLNNHFRDYLGHLRENYPRVNDVLVKTGLRYYGEIKVENGVPMMTKDNRADYYCEDNRTIGYNTTFEQANKHCADLGLEISFFPCMFNI